MKRLALLCLLCLGLLPCWAGAAEPRVRVEARLQPGNSVVVGGTLRLELDVLTDTWFSSAPQLPDLQLPGALVLPPGGEAQHLNVQRDGVAFFGLRYSYLITPRQVQLFSIPALSVSVMPGQASAPVSVRSEPLQFRATRPEGLAADENILVAQGLRLTQRISQSATPLTVGGSLTRELTLQADGAQAMSLPPPELAPVAGLRSYPAAPRISDLDDGRGLVSGGQRIDSVSYRVLEPGHYQLPTIELRWWDSSSNQLRSANLPAVSFDAQANDSYRAPFSISEDLQRLGQRSRLHLARHWLALAALLGLACALCYAGRSPWRRGWNAVRQRHAALRQAWLASAGYAWQRIPGQLRGQPARLDALYLWLRRSQGARSLGELRQPAAKALLAALGKRFQRPATTAALQPALKHLRDSLRRSAGKPARHALRPLNPSRPHATEERP